MRVGHSLVAQAAGSAAPARRPEGARAFTLDAQPQATAAGAAAPAAPMAGLDAILTLQSNADTPGERRRRSVRRGHDLLDGLDRLKASLLSGRVSTYELRTIAGRLAERAGESGDPRLDGLLADIELRAAVELAKLQAQQPRAA
jgi:hypothetical protein